MRLLPGREVEDEGHEDGRLGNGREMDGDLDRIARSIFAGLHRRESYARFLPRAQRTERLLQGGSIQPLPEIERRAMSQFVRRVAESEARATRRTDDPQTCLLEQEDLARRLLQNLTEP